MSKLGRDFKSLVAFRVSDFFIMGLTNLIIVFCYTCLTGWVGRLKKNPKNFWLAKLKKIIIILEY